SSLAATALREALARARCLLIADDVWSAAAVAAFRVAGPQGRVIYTTRNPAVLRTAGAQPFALGALPDAAARQLLANLTAIEVSGLPPEADAVLASSGTVALAVALVGAAIGRGGMPWGRAIAQLERLRAAYAGHPYADVFKALQLGLASLDDEVAGAYRL